MTDDAINRLLDMLFWVLMGLGVTTPINEFFGGLCLAVAAALGVRHFVPEKDRRELRLTIAIALLGAVIAAISGNMYLPDVIVQLKMCLAGAASLFIVRTFVRAGLIVERRTADVVDDTIDKITQKKDGKNDRT